MNAYFNMYLGTELKDKLDETFFSMLPIHSWVTGQHMRGVMSWDLATDCDYENSLSLQRAVVEEIRK